MLGLSPWRCLDKPSYENFMLAILVRDIFLMLFSSIFTDRYFSDLLAALAAPQLDKGRFMA